MSKAEHPVSHIPKTPQCHVEPARPSSWPCRNQRRHAVTIAFNAHVVDVLRNATARLEAIEKLLIQGAPPPRLGEALPKAASDVSSQTGVPEVFEKALDSLESRVQAMEFLLVPHSADRVPQAVLHTRSLLASAKGFTVMTVRNCRFTVIKVRNKGFTVISVRDKGFTVNRGRPCETA